MNVAATILAQLGGNQFITMTGANYLVATENGIQFSFKGYRVNKCRITLNVWDTYDVEFYKLYGAGCPQVGETQTGVQAAELQRVFTVATGLDCTL